MRLTAGRKVHSTRMLEEERKRRDALRHEFIEDYLLCGKKSLVERKKLVNEEGPEELPQIIQCLVDKSDPCIGYLYSEFIRATGNGLKEDFVAKGAHSNSKLTS
jgi:uncharacterized protein YnzC (UPF0291/DUF896 family)